MKFMKLTTIVIAILFTNVLSSQITVENKTDLIEHLEGKWQLDSYHLFGIINFPNEDGNHIYEFKPSAVDENGLIINVYLNGSLRLSATTVVGDRETNGYYKLGLPFIDTIPDGDDIIINDQLCINEEVSLNNLKIGKCGLGTDRPDVFFSRESEITAISEEEIVDAQQDHKIYPNPSYGSVSLEYLRNNISDRQITIYSAFGAEVYNSNSNNHITAIDLTDLSPGVYFIMISGNGISEVVNFLKL